ncbi:predicted protein [Pyrenophora tritici-repentis Pt-1C-BFP]|uniref:Uncharacterized protein n=1 Tax=Pyrenophora tritici-repentis (strain Pt-1C-BFP) TaxID=426418 RepID=B2W8H0_PYRTR|nr:uncharacterized protein PTRG_06278 [Pyrenophora tritici-repentis Pt-1C-BFP]EDU49198.1 predicted protein [Pyrenophora tritici-repentis Pt-1C-BFP]
MCTKVTLKHTTCNHDFWVRRNCPRHPTCNFPTEVIRERGGSYTASRKQSTSDVQKTS